MKQLTGQLTSTTDPSARQRVRRQLVLAETEESAVRHASPREAWRALWVRLVRWRRAVIAKAWKHAEWHHDRCEEYRDDLARGTTRAPGRSGRPYATATLRAMRSSAKSYGESFAEAARELQAAVDTRMPSYRDWCTALHVQAPVGPDVSQPADVPWRDWYPLVEGERRRLVLERGLLALERERLEGDRVARGVEAAP